MQSQEQETVRSAALRNSRIENSSSALNALWYAFVYQFYVTVAIQHGASHFEVGIMSAAPALGALLSPLWASLIRGRNPKPFVIAPNLIARLLLLLPAFFAMPSVFLASCLFFHFLVGIQAPAYASLVTRIYPPDMRGRFLSRSRMAMGAAMIPTSIGFGLWMDAAGSRGALLASSATGVLAILILSFVRPVAEDGQRGQEEAISGLNGLWRFLKTHRELPVFFIATTLCGFGNILGRPLFAILQVQVLHMSNFEISLTRVVYFLFLLAAYFFGGRLIDRFSPRQALVWSIGAYALAPLAFVLLKNHFGMLASNAVYGVADALWDIGILTYVLRAAPGNEATVFSLHQLLYGIRGSLAPIVGTSLLGSLSMGTLLAAASISCGIAFVLFVRKGNASLSLHGRGRPSDQPQAAPVAGRPGR